MTVAPVVTPVVAVFGATSDIAAATARLYAEAGGRLVLAGRDRQALAALAADLSVRGAEQVVLIEADFSVVPDIVSAAAAAWAAFGFIDTALLCYAVAPDQAAMEQDPALAATALTVNFTSPVLLLNELARMFQARKSGTLAVITSVAGDRGRKSNNLYGAAKGGLQRYLEGLRHRLHSSGVGVLDIRPGFVATKITFHLKRGGPLWATPDRIARDIVRAVNTGRDVIYTPWFWRGIMAVVRNIPKAIFHRTSL